MSRYSKEIEMNGKPVQVNWGFDRVLGYWYDIIDPEQDELGGIIEERSSYGGSMNGPISRGEYLEFLYKIKAPEKHKSLVGLDYPF